MIDVYNLFNASTVVLVTDTYGTTGAAWLRPEQILPGRYANTLASMLATLNTCRPG
jgi:hypothetical protein